MTQMLNTFWASQESERYPKSYYISEKLANTKKSWAKYNMTTFTFSSLVCLISAVVHVDCTSDGIAKFKSDIAGKISEKQTTLLTISDTCMD